jgi:hypothetical protein
MRRIPTKPSRGLLDNSDNLTPPWRAADTDTSSGQGVQSKKGKGPAWTGTRTAMRSSGSTSQTANPLSYSSLDAEDADEEEFEDDDMEEEDDIGDEEDEEDDHLKEPTTRRIGRSLCSSSSAMMTLRDASRAQNGSGWCQGRRFQRYGRLSWGPIYLAKRSWLWKM